MYKKKHMLLVATSLAVASTVFVACGDDSSSGTKEPAKVATVKDLPTNCEEGDEALVGEKEDLYTCTDGKWKNAEEPEKPASSATAESSSSEEEEEVKSSSSSKKRQSSSSAEEEKPASSSSTTTTISVGSMTDGRDQKTYETVKIGKQVWMRQYLDYEMQGSSCHESDENCEKYGRRYTLDAANQACPAGWHLPSKDDFEILLTESEGLLKASSGWNDCVTLDNDDNEKSRENGNGTDDYGFTLLPTGPGENGQKARVWSSTPIETNKYYFFAATSCNGPIAFIQDGAPSTASLNIRCLQSEST